jgi:hypothetical protein
VAKYLSVGAMMAFLQAGVTVAAAAPGHHSPLGRNFTDKHTKMEDTNQLYQLLG